MTLEPERAVVWKGPLESSSMRIDVDTILEHAFSRSQLKSLLLLRRSNPEVSIKKLICYILLNESDHHIAYMLDRFALQPPARMSLQEDAGMTNWHRNDFIQSIMQAGTYIPD